MKTHKPLKKAQENWIKLAISQSGPAATLKQKALVHNTQGETVLGDVFPALLFLKKKKNCHLKLGMSWFVLVLTFDLRDAAFHYRTESL